MSSLGNFIQQLFSEPGPNGTVSWGRVASAVALVAGVAWISHIVYVMHTLPAFDGVTAFVLAPYAANKTGAAIQAYSNNPVPGK